MMKLKELSEKSCTNNKENKWDCRQLNKKSKLKLSKLLGMLMDHLSRGNPLILQKLTCQEVISAQSDSN